MIRILYLSANPFSDISLDLTKEYRGLVDSLASTPYGDLFSLEYEFNATFRDLESLLHRCKPDIVQLALYGNYHAGLFFADSFGGHLMPAEFFLRSGSGAVGWLAIANALGRGVQEAIQCVLILLPIWDNERQYIANNTWGALVTVDKLISFEQSENFTRGFYEGLGSGKGLSYAFRKGCMRLPAGGITDPRRFTGKPIILWNSHLPSSTTEEYSTDNPFVLIRKPAEMEAYVDFDLHIASNGHIIAESPEGEATADIVVQPSKDIQLSLKRIEQRQTDADLLKQVGESLYGWLFPSPIHTHLQQTEAVARRDKAKLRLRLCVEASTIASLPLEFLYRAIGGYYLAVNPGTVLSRYLNLPLPAERVRRREGLLHMLAIVADPTDQTRLDPDEWEGIINRALAKPLADGQMTLQTVRQATRKGIRNALLAQKPDIIQFVGHGIYRDGKGYVALVDEDTGKTWLVDDQSFAGLYMGYDDNLGLISLATCESAQSDNPQGFLGIAPQLVQRGVPAVVAMQYSVYIDTAKVFLEDFYTAVASRKPIDWATQSARNAISLQFGLDNREFVTPVLYMRDRDGDVF